MPRISATNLDGFPTRPRVRTPGKPLRPVRRCRADFRWRRFVAVQQKQSSEGLSKGSVLRRLPLGGQSHYAARWGRAMAEQTNSRPGFFRRVANKVRSFIKKGRKRRDKARTKAEKARSKRPRSG